MKWIPLSERLIATLKFAVFIFCGVLNVENKLQLTIKKQYNKFCIKIETFTDSSKKIIYLIH